MKRQGCLLLCYLLLPFLVSSGAGSVNKCQHGQPVSSGCHQSSEEALDAVLQQAGAGQLVDARLPIDRRVQWGHLRGYCGEVSVQMVAASHGVWVSQQQLRDLNDGELLVDTEGSVEKVLETLGFSHNSWSEDAPQGTNPQLYTAYVASFVAWLKQNLVAGMVPIFGAKVAGGSDPEYDHIMPAYGMQFRAPQQQNRSRTAAAAHFAQGPSSHGSSLGVQQQWQQQQQPMDGSGAAVGTVRESGKTPVGGGALQSLHRRRSIWRRRLKSLGLSRPLHHGHVFSTEGSSGSGSGDGDGGAPQPMPPDVIIPGGSTGGGGTTQPMLPDVIIPGGSSSSGGDATQPMPPDNSIPSGDGSSSGGSPQEMPPGMSLPVAGGSSSSSSSGGGGAPQPMPPSSSITVGRTGGGSPREMPPDMSFPVGSGGSGSSGGAPRPMPPSNSISLGRTGGGNPPQVMPPDMSLPTDGGSSGSTRGSPSRSHQVIASHTDTGSVRRLKVVQHEKQQQQQQIVEEQAAGAADAALVPNTTEEAGGGDDGSLSASDILVWTTNYGDEIQRPIGNPGFFGSRDSCEFEDWEGGCISSDSATYAVAMGGLQHSPAAPDGATEQPPAAGRAAMWLPDGTFDDAAGGTAATARGAFAAATAAATAAAAAANTTQPPWGRIKLTITAWSNPRVPANAEPHPKLRANATAYILDVSGCAARGELFTVFRFDGILPFRSTRTAAAAAADPQEQPVLANPASVQELVARCNSSNTACQSVSFEQGEVQVLGADKFGPIPAYGVTYFVCVKGQVSPRMSDQRPVV